MEETEFDNPFQFVPDEASTTPLMAAYNWAIANPIIDERIDGNGNASFLVNGTEPNKMNIYWFNYFVKTGDFKPHGGFQAYLDMLHGWHVICL